MNEYSQAVLNYNHLSVGFAIKKLSQHEEKQQFQAKRNNKLHNPPTLVQGD